MHAGCFEGPQSQALLTFGHHYASLAACCCVASSPSVFHQFSSLRLTSAGVQSSHYINKLGIMGYCRFYTPITLSASKGRSSDRVTASHLTWLFASTTRSLKTVTMDCGHVSLHLPMRFPSYVGQDPPPWFCTLETLQQTLGVHQ